MNKNSKEKNTFTIPKLLHSIFNILKKIYAICKVLEAIKNLFS